MKATPRSTGCVVHAPSLCIYHPGALAAQSEETGPACTSLFLSVPFGFFAHFVFLSSNEPHQFFVFKKYWNLIF